jgi:hypothetical protein
MRDQEWGPKHRPDTADEIRAAANERINYLLNCLDSLLWCNNVTGSNARREAVREIVKAELKARRLIRQSSSSASTDGR